jgi:hypothetical protein
LFAAGCATEGQGMYALPKEAMDELSKGFAPTGARKRTRWKRSSAFTRNRLPDGSAYRRCAVRLRAVRRTDGGQNENHSAFDANPYKSQRIAGAFESAGKAILPMWAACLL